MEISPKSGTPMWEFLLLEHPNNPCHHHFHFRYHDEDGGGHCEGDIIYIEAKY